MKLTQATIIVSRCRKCQGTLTVVGYGMEKCDQCGQYYEGFGEKEVEPPSQDYLDYCRRHGY